MVFWAIVSRIAFSSSQWKPTYHQTGEGAVRADAHAAGETVDGATTAGDARVLYALYLARGGIVFDVALAHLAAIAGGESGPQIAIVLDASGENGGARTSIWRRGGGRGGNAKTGVFWALGDDHLVLDVVVDHVELVAVGFGASVDCIGGCMGEMRPVGVLGRGSLIFGRIGVWRQEKEHPGPSARLRARVYANGSEMNVLLVYGRPALEQKFRNLGEISGTPGRLQAARP